jgi:hypothetical protein
MTATHAGGCRFASDRPVAASTALWYLGVPGDMGFETR